ncbi:glutaminase [Flammeovirga pacifica]|uniref:Glutaminase n=1 Tax=Flammeovirga pacifica TaxID=915059 RepID=A0A1S1YUY9_FLAPC|nr:glutaminase [Flammeovirga pacifica]OHX64683.1 glutaminase [Flammeovirga pacifica]
MHRIANHKEIIQKIYQEIIEGDNLGAPAGYIPNLAKVDPNHFGVYFMSTQEDNFGIGDWEKKFSIQSISKVLSLSLAYQILGDSIWSRVGVEPSGSAFNSLVRLETDNGIPRNPFLNGGAIVICDLLFSQLDNPLEDFIQFVREVSGCEEINYSEEVAKSEASVGYRNIALCNFIKSFGNIDNDPNDVLHFYFHICSIEMNCYQLTKAFEFLMDGRFKTKKGSSVLNLSQAKRINAIMQTCGFYDESGEFSFKVGLPGKSGVGGGIVAVHPEKYCICVWSPNLNKNGNSYRGMKFLERFTTETELSIF